MKNAGVHEMLREASSCQPTRKQGLQSCDHQEHISANNLNVHESRFIPRASRNEYSFVNTLIFVFEKLYAEDSVESCCTQISDFQKCETINLYFFKPLNFW